MRREDRKISLAEGINILIKAEYGVLSMTTPDSKGYGVPLNFVIKENNLYFHCAPEGSKLDYLRNNNKVSFCAVGNTKLLHEKFGTIYESVIVNGKISEIEGEEKRAALLLFVEKYSSEYISEGNEYIDRFYEKVKIIKLTSDSITGKARRQ